jgi:hypothetical protein
MPAVNPHLSCRAAAHIEGVIYRDAWKRDVWKRDTWRRRGVRSPATVSLWSASGLRFTRDRSLKCASRVNTTCDEAHGVQRKRASASRDPGHHKPVPGFIGNVGHPPPRRQSDSGHLRPRALQCPDGSRCFSSVAIWLLHSSSGRCENQLPGTEADIPGRFENR